MIFFIEKKMLNDECKCALGKQAAVTFSVLSFVG